MQAGVLQRPLLAVALLRQVHQHVGAFHGQLGLLVAGDQAGDLPERCHDPAIEHVAGDQRTDTEVAGDDAVDAGNDHRHAGQLLQEQGAVERHGGQQARVTLEPAQGAVGAFPLVLTLALCTAAFQGFQAAEGFDQQRLAFGPQSQAALHGVAQAVLDDVGEQRGDGEGE
ncbi:hypothetical protein D3C81_1452320 [compost metagenome]